MESVRNRSERNGQRGKFQILKRISGSLKGQAGEGYESIIENHKEPLLLRIRREHDSLLETLGSSLRYNKLLKANELRETAGKNHQSGALHRVFSTAQCKGSGGI